MAKSAKKTSTARPPEPSDSHAVIQAWMREAMPALQPIVKALDKRIRDAIPGLQYGIKWKKAYYGTPELGWIIEMVAYDVSVNVVFFAGAKFDPPPPLGEGSRYVKVKSLEEAKAPEIQAWIEQAAELPGWH